MSSSDAKPSANIIDVATVYDNCKDVLQEGRNKLARNMLSRNNVVDVLRDSAVAASYTYKYSDSLKQQGKATSQRSSGRCWIFACLNVIRLNFIKKFNLSNDFELSQSYLFFFDKLERVQFFLDNIVDTASEPLDGRLLAHLVTAPVQDGGQWDMLANLITKYGLVPKSVFPDPHCATASRKMNRFLTTRLRTFARDLRGLVAAKGKDSEEVAKAKATMIAEVTRELVVFFGVPPKTFTWTFADKDGKFGALRDITPQQFYREHADFDMSKKISLIHDPRNEYYQLYTVDRLGNMVGGRPVTYLNVDIDVLKSYARKTLEAGNPVWFGCDVGKQSDRETASMDPRIYDYNLVFGADTVDLSKRERLDYGESLMTHAMVFVGFDRDPADPDNKVAAWQVENSWGEKGPDKGRWIMTDDWFSEWVYQIVVDVDDLDDKTRQVLNLEAHRLPAWDPMGALASSL